MSSVSDDEAIWAGNESPGPGRRRAIRRARGRISGCLPVLVVLALIAGLGVIVVRVLRDGPEAIPFVGDKIAAMFADPEDYQGPGEGSVTFEVLPGDTLAVIGGNLTELDVVASSEAFEDAANKTPGSDVIQAGLYVMKKQMSAQGAVDLLISGETRGTSFTVSPGKTVKELVQLLSKELDIPRRDFNQALRNPQALGLPASAKGNPEGYFFPATYPLMPGASATSVLRAMAEGYQRFAARIDLTARARELGYTQHEIMTVASIIQAEAATLGQRDRAKVARVIYNRLEEVPPNPSAGFLQMDSTVHYVLGDNSNARPTTAELDRAARSPYSTYAHKGLPPGPIGAPGEAAVEAALSPPPGNWFFFVTVNLATGRTLFSETYDEFLTDRAKLDAYCARPQTRSC